MGEISSEGMGAISQHSQTSGTTHLSPYDKFMYKATLLPLRDIVNLKFITQCIIVAKTSRLKAVPGGWYYKACHACTMVAKGTQPPYVCGKGHRPETIIYRYKILIDVVHEGCETTFVLGNRKCLQLLKLSLAQIRSTMLEAGISDPLEFPLALDALVGLDLAFKVKWQPSWNNAPSTSSATPKKLQITESVNDALPIDDWNMVDDVDVTSNQIMLTPTPSATSKNDAPGLSTEHSPLPTTPSAASKRFAPQGSSELPMANGFCEEQGSSKKLK